MYLLILLFLWVTFAAILDALVNAIPAVFQSFPKKLFYWVLTLPLLWARFVASRPYGGTVGRWFSALADWLKS